MPGFTPVSEALGLLVNEKMERERARISAQQASDEHARTIADTALKEAELQYMPQQYARQAKMDDANIAEKNAQAQNWASLERVRDQHPNDKHTQLYGELFRSLAGTYSPEVAAQHAQAIADAAYPEGATTGTPASVPSVGAGVQPPSVALAGATGANAPVAAPVAPQPVVSGPSGTMSGEDEWTKAQQFVEQQLPPRPKPLSEDYLATLNPKGRAVVEAAQEKKERDWEALKQQKINSVLLEHARSLAAQDREKVQGNLERWRTRREEVDKLRADTARKLGMDRLALSWKQFGEHVHEFNVRDDRARQSQYRIGLGSLQDAVRKTAYSYNASLKEYQGLQRESAALHTTLERYSKLTNDQKQSMDPKELQTLSQQAAYAMQRVKDLDGADGQVASAHEMASYLYNQHKDARHGLANANGAAIKPIGGGLGTLPGIEGVPGLENSPRARAVRGAKTGRVLSDIVARRFWERSGHNAEKARKMAIDAGYSVQ
jgi:hypothetical protein